MKDNSASSCTLCRERIKRPFVYLSLYNDRTLNHRTWQPYLPWAFTRLLQKEEWAPYTENLCCRDKPVRVWAWNAGEGYVDMSYSPLTGHKYGVTCIRFSPQGTMLATSSVDGSTMLWNVRVGNICYHLVLL
jgi:WD40 repeat protein